MTRIRRAAVTGLFAIWLAPLSAGVQGQPAGASSNCANGPATQVESLAAEGRGSRRGRNEHDAACEGEDGDGEMASLAEILGDWRRDA
ncbi:hypothetical protein [Neoroseomonas soli]|uniref:Secreted protein n=1 Tax=Neoroseomonas soli TaxID=1081025 RepID=A0A9X9WV87_9PROT|nr:hypothetical protein [Neoroseomonas soli]MBR0671066.1 hypothetical protein [Neoroseomonas soli]